MIFLLLYLYSFPFCSIVKLAQMNNLHLHYEEETYAAYTDTTI